MQTAALFFFQPAVRAVRFFFPFFFFLRAVPMNIYVFKAHLWWEALVDVRSGI